MDLGALDTALEFRCGKMALSIKVSGATIKRTVRGLSGTQMVTFTRVNSKMTKATAMVSSLASIAPYTRVSGRMIFSMVKANTKLFALSNCYIGGIQTLDQSQRFESIFN